MIRFKYEVQAILEDWRRHKWTLQGFGMLRTYLDEAKTVRLHVWDRRFQAPNVSLMHTHPWDFRSQVIAGSIRDAVFREVPARVLLKSMPYMRQTVLCGAGGGLVGEPKLVHIEHASSLKYTEGMTYEHKAADIHVSYPADGAVTLVERTFGSDVDHAEVYWSKGDEFGSAEPRPATAWEIGLITGYSLYRWFNRKGDTR